MSSPKKSHAEIAAVTAQEEVFTASRKFSEFVPTTTHTQD
jgi:hypothetical protein